MPTSRTTHALPHGGGAIRAAVAVVAAALQISAGALCAAAGTARLSELRVEGHESLSRREVSSIVAPRGRVDTTESAMAASADSLLASLTRAGHPFARVEIGWRDVDDGVALDVRISEGPRATLSSLQFVRSDGRDARAGRLPGLRRGSAITESAVRREVETVLADLEESGHPFAEVGVTGVSLAADGGLSLRMEVDEGLETRFARLAVSGNVVTRSGVIERESGVVPGEPYSAARVSAVRARLERLGFFSSVSEPVVSVDPLTGLATVGVEVEEGRSSRVLGVLGYSAGRDGSGDTFTGLLDVGLGNIAGTGREAAARWQRIRSGYTRIVFSYREPWLLGSPVDVGVQGEQTVNDTIYTTTEGDLLVTARMGEATRVTWSVGAERYVPGAFDESTTTSYRTSMAGEYDGTDAPGNPTRGTTLSGTATYSAKKGEGGERHRAGTFGLSASGFVSTRPRQVIALTLSAATVVSTEDDVPFHEQLPLGGAASLRGYREEQFRGTRIGLASVEYRFLLSRRSRALVFMDAGYYYRGGSNFAKDVKLGYGIGLRGETRLGIIALDYGLGEGDGLLDGKLHVGLIREF